ncbi:uncharacterized protein EDB93DRAFT_1104276 [Suillus bovinus]|uniref:uncharacterized protein n=1 Tax=Suillus bovinus TaxID=48563 RepID=UPI001B8613B7|nr:uncharacterized protein EDB93DRAFT_1104276 [Suillus bovinus]KAG2146493.1 hypothetical protein EDB93DRAFT_1104276 [Suillus bovinus]
MPLQSYVLCTCKSFNCKYNPDGSRQKLQMAQIGYQTSALPCGLVWQININWFQIVKGKSGYHSTVAFYTVICNNLCEIQYLAEETILLMVISGPDKSSLEQMNYLIELFVESMLRLKKNHYPLSYNCYNSDEVYCNCLNKEDQEYRIKRVN